MAFVNTSVVMHSTPTDPTPKFSRTLSLNNEPVDIPLHLLSDKEQ